MKRKQHSTEEIIRILRQVDEEQTVDAVCRDHNISKASFHRWRRKYDGTAQASATSQKILSLLG